MCKYRLLTVVDKMALGQLIRKVLLFYVFFFCLFFYKINKQNEQQRPIPVSSSQDALNELEK